MTMGEMIRRLVEAGATPEILAIAVESVEKISVDNLQTVRRQSADMADTNADRRRKKDRIRKREKRLLNRELAKANDVAKPPKNHADKIADVSAKNVVDISTSPLISSEEGNRDKGKKERVVTRARGTRLTADAVLLAQDRKFAIDYNIDPDFHWAEFKDFWVGIPGQRGLKLDWSATWRNRVRDVGTKGAKNGKGTRYRHTTSAADNFRAGMAQALSRRPESRLFAAQDRGEQSAEREPAQLHLIGSSKIT